MSEAHERIRRLTEWTEPELGIPLEVVEQEPVDVAVDVVKQEEREFIQDWTTAFGDTAGVEPVEGLPESEVVVADVLDAVEERNVLDSGVERPQAPADPGD